MSHLGSPGRLVRKPAPNLGVEGGHLLLQVPLGLLLLLQLLLEGILLVLHLLQLGAQAQLLPVLLLQQLLLQGEKGCRAQEVQRRPSRFPRPWQEGGAGPADLGDSW